MKNIILALSIMTLMVSCDNQKKIPAQKIVEVGKSPLVDEHIMSEVSHGLHKIKIDDTTTILLYRGVESCTMIQIK